jgi:hypothetical protein
MVASDWLYALGFLNEGDSSGLKFHFERAVKARDFELPQKLNEIVHFVSSSRSTRTVGAR